MWIENFQQITLPLGVKLSDFDSFFRLGNLLNPPRLRHFEARQKKRSSTTEYKREGGNFQQLTHDVYKLYNIKTG